MPQLVGQKCVLCQHQINSILEGKFCNLCGNPHHHRCRKLSEEGPRRSICALCGGHVDHRVGSEVLEERERNLKKNKPSFIQIFNIFLIIISVDLVGSILIFIFVLTKIASSGGEQIPLWYPLLLIAVLGMLIGVVAWGLLRPIIRAEKQNRAFRKGQGLPPGPVLNFEDQFDLMTTGGKIAVFLLVLLCLYGMVGAIGYHFLFGGYGPNRIYCASTIVGSLVGGMIGHSIDRYRGNSGLLGLLVGTILPLAAPLMLLRNPRVRLPCFHCKKETPQHHQVCIFCGKERGSSSASSSLAVSQGISIDNK